MPSPTRRTLTGTFQTPDGTPAVGRTVTFQLLSTLTDGNDNVIVATEKITATLDNAGALSVSLVSDSGDVAPQPVYFVRELFGDTRGYSIVIPAGSGSIDLSDLAPVGPSPTPPSAYALLTEMEAADAAVLAAAEAYADDHGGTGAVASVNGHVGVVVLGPADVGADAAGAAATSVAVEAARAIAVESAKADLVAGKVPTSQLPALPTFTTHSVSSQAAMLALSAAEGDVAIRSDQHSARYLLTDLPASALGNWLLLDSDPTAAVDSVNGQIGTVVLGAADVGADASGAATTAQATAIAAAATDATTKAGAAQAAAILAAAADATTKANAAQAAAATDATAKVATETARALAVEALKADLVGGKVPTSQLPAIPTFTTHSVASQAAMLALGCPVGDVAIRTDATNARYLLTALPASTLGNWLLLDSDPLAGVDTVNGQSGTVILGKADVGLGNVDNTSDANKPVSTAQAAANAAVVASSAQRASNLSDLASASTARTNLGLGSVATHAASEFLTPLTPTATKTAAYTAVVGDLAMMNVAGGGTPLTLPTTPADKSIVGFRAMGATAAVPLVVNAGGSDTIGTAGLTTTSVQLADEETFLQYQASGTRWLAISNVKTQASLDGRYLLLSTVTTKGDLLAATAASTVARVGVGSNGQVLTADSAQTAGVKWAAAAGGQVATSSEGAHSGLYYTPPMPSSALSSAANTVGVMTAIPIVMPSCTLSAIGLRVLTLAAGSLIRVGIYSDDGTGYPGALLLDAGQISGAATGLVTATISQAVSGLIWLVAVNQTGTPSVQSTTLTQWGLGVDSGNAVNAIGGNSFSGYSQTGVTAALPANFTTTVTVLGAGAARMIVKV